MPTSRKQLLNLNLITINRHDETGMSLAIVAFVVTACYRLNFADPHSHCKTRLHSLKLPGCYFILCTPLRVT